jgi:hypothetical protein
MVGLVGANYTLYYFVVWTCVFKYSPDTATLSDSPELTYLATPVKSVLLLFSTEVNYSVRSPKLGASETRPYSCTTRFVTNPSAKSEYRL